MQNLVKIERAIISVSNKSELDYLVQQLFEINPDIEVISSGGTARAIREIMGKDCVMEVSDYTGQPEMKSGLVKTLHPKIHAGILADTDNPDDMAYLEEHRYPLIDMVVVNLYPFEKTSKDLAKTIEQVREQIDIGGPAMLRAAAKNFKRVTAVPETISYDSIISRMRENDGALKLRLRALLAERVFSITSGYDGEIENYIYSQFLEGEDNLNRLERFYLGGLNAR